MNWFLIFVILVMVIALLAVNVYVLVYFQHPDDKNTAYFPKFLVIFGMLFAEATVLLLPLDVANNTTAVGCDAGWNTTCGGLAMQTFWLIVFMGIAVFIVVLLPTTIYYYEADDGQGNKTNNRACEAIKYETLTLVVSLLVLLILFETLAQTRIPVQRISQDSLRSLSPSAAVLTGKQIAQSKAVAIESLEIVMDVSFPIYTTALLSFIGWFAFVVFGAIGIVALPMDLILAFVYRPKFIPADIYAQQKIALQSRAAELISLGKAIKERLRAPAGAAGAAAADECTRKTRVSLWEKRKQKKLDKVTLNQFKQSVYLLEQDIEELQACHAEYKNYNPLIPAFKLLCGCLASILSVLWLLQIGLVMLVPRQTLGGFLSDYFIWFDTWFALFGTISVGLFSFYLLAAVVKGCFKFGMRCFCCAVRGRGDRGDRDQDQDHDRSRLLHSTVLKLTHGTQLHPMQLNKTYMNSFLFNLGLILICCIPVVQFCDQAFSDYTRLTGIQTIMGAQIRYLKIFAYFWANNVFVYAFLAITATALVYLLLRPADQSSDYDKIRLKIEKQLRTAV